MTAFKGFTQLLSQEGKNRYLEVVLDELKRIEEI
ncbi:hypothetical protein ACFSCZ_11585 [Siminovitchia sediminis]|uniref:Uncharacterized protein n=1 Tax=Siminovitchia sediminis TaxID=1274353 RepID=A0ABW4KJ33_9BACI